MNAVLFQAVICLLSVPARIYYRKHSHDRRFTLTVKIWLVSV